MSETKEHIMYAVIGRTGIPVCVSGMKRESIRKFIEDTNLTWQQWRDKYGVSCQRVTVTVFPK